MDKRWRLILALMTAALAVMDGGYAYYKGVTLAGDTAGYSRWANLLISKNYDIPAYLGDANFVVPPILYLGWVLVVALCKTAFGDSWATGLVVMNLFLAVATGFMIFSLAYKTTRSLIPPITAFVLFIACYDIHVWIPQALSDISFMALSTVIAYFLASGYAREKRSFVILSAPVFLSMIALIYRPTAIPIITTVIVFYGMKLFFDDISALKRALFARRLFISLMLLFALVSVAHGFVMQDPSLWPLSFARGWIEQLSGEYRQGIVVYARPETYATPPVSAFDFILITVKKFAYYFAIDAKGFSLAHGIINYAFFIPAYSLSLVAIASLLSPNSSFSSGSWMTVFISFLTIMFYMFFHACQQIEFDWRYRLPCMPLLIILAAMGMGEIEARWRRLREPVSVMAR